MGRQLHPADLASIHSDQQMAFLVAELANRDPANRYWIGEMMRMIMMRRRRRNDD